MERLLPQGRIRSETRFVKRRDFDRKKNTSGHRDVERKKNRKRNAQDRIKYTDKNRTKKKV
jgi:hypothetical protein